MAQSHRSRDGKAVNKYHNWIPSHKKKWETDCIQILTHTRTIQRSRTIDVHLPNIPHTNLICILQAIIHHKQHIIQNCLHIPYNYTSKSLTFIEKTIYKYVILMKQEQTNAYERTNELRRRGRRRSYLLIEEKGPEKTKFWVRNLYIKKKK